MTKRIILLSLALCLALAGCAGASSKSGAVAAVEAYYQAIIQQDADQMSAITCADYEDQALLELDSFQGVETVLENLACSESGEEGGATLVKCTGKIVASYGNEKMDFDLADRVHKVVNQSGDWRVCGY